MTLALVTIVVWTVGGGLYPRETRWSSLTCNEIWVNAEERLAIYGGGQIEMACEEFKPLHESDLDLPALGPAQLGGDE